MNNLPNVGPRPNKTYMTIPTEINPKTAADNTNYSAVLPFTIRGNNVYDADGSRVIVCSEDRLCSRMFKEEKVDADWHFICPECGRLGQRCVELRPTYGAYSCYLHSDAQNVPPFIEFPKIARLSREVIITEKIDGTNAQILITEDGQLLTGSRTRWITPQDDNNGFAAWAHEHREELLTLGPGRHFGEWWGSAIQRGYGLPKGEKRLSLFNVSRWCLHGGTPQQIPTADPRIVKMQDVLPPCCHLVPVLYRGVFTTQACEDALAWLRENGSAASPGFMKPEGIVCFHVAGNVGFKKTLERDLPKQLSPRP